jgi:hypothetical protein
VQERIVFDTHDKPFFNEEEEEESAIIWNFGTHVSFHQMS